MKDSNAKEERAVTATIMVQGTASHVGKTVLAAALCRILSDRGVKVAPFKAQNMALNSAVVYGSNGAAGGEIGRAQAFQAMAARCEPTVDMNPILLKPSQDSVSQVIVHGKVYATMTAREYHAFKKQAREFVLESYKKLASDFDAIVIEGAGSPAEINLRENDIANMGVAEMTGSPVLLVGDIDRGGVFASLVGTLELLAEEERARVKGFIINMFRGDKTLLDPGLEFIEKKTGIPVLGVVPFLKGADLPDEDGTVLARQETKGVLTENSIRVAVIKLPRIANFTDIDPFSCEQDVVVEYVDGPAELKGADMVVIPGSKNTVSDMLWMMERGFEAALRNYVDAGGTLAGICGGFQMMGHRIVDDAVIGSKEKEAEGLALLDMETVMADEKETFQVTADCLLKGMGRGAKKVTGYEIHMGRTRGNLKPFARITARNSAPVDIPDGGVACDGRVWGTYLHGIFDNDDFRNTLLNGLRKKRGLPLRKVPVSFARAREKSITEFAKTVEESLDMDGVLKIMGL
ncbi:MAG: cobyric acid synthase [Candidatus Binatia bacterium]